MNSASGRAMGKRSVLPVRSCPCCAISTKNVSGSSEGPVPGHLLFPLATSVWPPVQWRLLCAAPSGRGASSLCQPKAATGCADLRASRIHFHPGPIPGLSIPPSPWAEAWCEMVCETGLTLWSPLLCFVLGIESPLALLPFLPQR